MSQVNALADLLVKDRAHREQAVHLAAAVCGVEPGYLHSLAIRIGTNGIRGADNEWSSMAFEAWSRAKARGWESMWWPATRYDMIGWFLNLHAAYPDDAFIKAATIYASNVLPNGSRRTKGRRIAKMLLSVGGAA